MAVDADTVRRVAHLARIAVAEDEVAGLQGELNAILAFVEQLGEVDVEGVEPMTSVTPMAMKMREDKVTDGEIADDIIGMRRPMRIILPRAQGGGIAMCLACEQDSIWLAYLESKGLLKADDPAAVEALFSAFPVQPMPVQAEWDAPTPEAPMRRSRSRRPKIHFRATIRR